MARAIRDMDYGLAMAAGQDAGDKSAREGGRYAWNEDDWNAAAAVVDSLLGAEQGEYAQ